MTALTQAVAEGDTTLYIDTAFAEGSFPGYIKIDSELLQVGGVEHRNPLLLTLSNPASGIEDSFSDLGRRVSGNSDKVQSASGKLINTAGDNTSLNPRVVPAHVKVPGEIFVYVQRAGAAPTTGQALIYALIAEPSA